jgi:hypothetical protein
MLYNYDEIAWFSLLFMQLIMAVTIILWLEYVYHNEDTYPDH